MPLTLIAIIIIVIILAAVIIYVTRPLFKFHDEPDEESLNNLSDRLKSEYNDVLERIRELDFDFNLGKLTEKEHNDQRDELLAHAAHLRNMLKTGEKHSPSSDS
jgi:hypothetical protein